MKDGVKAIERRSDSEIGSLERKECSARGEFQWHSNHPPRLVSPENICIEPQ